MSKLVCSKCMKVYDGSKNGRCPHCGSGPPRVYEFRNSDEYLKEQIPRVLEERKKAGLEGLVGGMDFLIRLVGSPDEGLKRIFTVASEHTLLVNEYIHRYGDFDGFFTKSNVTLLTGVTDKQ